MTVAFFDLDHTVLSVNSGSLWVKYQYQKGVLSRGDLVKTLAYLLGYRFALVDVEKIVNVAVARIDGMPEADMRQEVHDWYESEVRQHVNPIMKRVIKDHGDAGHKLVLLTASSPYISEKVCEELGFDDFLSTRFEVHEGKFTGRLHGPMCYGAAKVTYGQKWLSDHERLLNKAWFYSDSFTDLPMLEAVGNPVAVNPDPRLERWARKHGVQILKGK
jgi:HAD superfamily hydrolase (TIGR01490 family)